MTPMLIVTHTESGDRDIDAEHIDLRGVQGPFHFQVVDSQDESQVYKSNGGFATYDDARLAGVTALSNVLDGQ